MQIQENRLSILSSFYTNQPVFGVGVNFNPNTNGMIWGPYIPIEPGNYICCFLSEQASAKVAECFSFDICNLYGEILVQRTNTVSTQNGFSFEFSTDIYLEKAEFRLYQSGEFGALVTGFTISRVDRQPMNMLSDTYLAIKFKQEYYTALLNGTQKCSSSVLMIQSADSWRYNRILDVSSNINKTYCQRWSIDYESFSGVFYGDKPFHAMYNDAGILWVLLQRGYRGWVIYIDSDVVVSDFTFDAKSFLLSKRDEGIHMIFHQVFENSHPKQFWGNVNSAIFAIDLSSILSQALVLTWHAYYNEFINKKDYSLATQWCDLLHDQQTLVRIIVAGKEFLEDKIEFCTIEGKYVFCATRTDDTCESDEEELQNRMALLREFGIQLGLDM